jgi:catechol 2,3-dioxygenase-like lactoylglutathione lyase family enzyme
MLNHLSIGVSDLSRSIAFYDAAFMALGYTRVWNGETAAGYGLKDGEDQFAIKLDKSNENRGSSSRSHIAFTAKTRVEVIAFYEAALQNGGKDNGKPGPRPNYGLTYFAAFIIDPDGYKIEAVCLQ